MTVETNHGSHTIKVKLRGDHNYQFVTENGTYYKKCSACGHTTLPQAIPSAEITAPDRVCSGQDCVVTVGALPNGVTVDGGFYEFGLMGSSFEINGENGVLSGTVSHEWYKSGADTFDVGVRFKTSDGYFFTAKKTVRVLSQHTGGTATCVEPAHCEKCGEPYGELNPNRHTDCENFFFTDTFHKGVCMCGVTITPEEPHTWEDGVCTKCYYNCRHTGGTATCTERATCDICGEQYGNAKGHDFGGWLKNSDGHWRACTVCGEKENEASHTPGDAATETTPQICTVCHYEITPATGHTHNFNRQNTDESYLKSAATCTSKAVYYYTCDCGVCGEETFTFGEKLLHDYSTEWSSDDEKHWFVCSACGRRSEEAAHTDSDLNHGCDICQRILSICVDEDRNHFCDICGRMLTKHHYATDWSGDGNTHWHACIICGNKADEAAHAEPNKGHKCDVCGKTLTECADSNKDHKCDICGKKLTEHTGGVATCKDKAKCNICGAEYGELDPKNHALDSTQEWITNADTHEKKWSCCGAVTVASEAHEWSDGVCNECGYACLHTDTDKNHICDYCGKTISSHEDTDKDHYCDYCGVNLTPIVYGDVNGDGKVTAADVLLIRKNIAGQNVPVSKDVADVNCDGKLTASDVLLIRKYIAGQNVKLGK